MRPQSSEMLAGRSRKSSYTEPTNTDGSISDQLHHHLRPHQQQHQQQQPQQPRNMTFFLADEATMASATTAPSGSMTNNTSTRRDKMRDTSILIDPLTQSDHDMVNDFEEGSEMMDEEMEEGEEEEDDEHASVSSFPLSITDNLPPSQLLFSPSFSTPSSPPPQHLHQQTISNISLSSTPNLSSKSLNLDLETEVKTRIPLRRSSTVLQDAFHKTKMGQEGADIVAQEFIMPTIKMPARRPFTARGKDLGRLKVLVAGDSGIGKTSLIKAILQLNEDIVHVDPATTGAFGSTGISAASSYSSVNRSENESTRKIAEVYASTKPYPHWWSDYEDSRVLRRRKSGGEVVLERNLCFVDTPGYGAGTASFEGSDPVVKYVEQQLEKTISVFNTGDGDLLSLLTGSGSSQVDLVLYIILHRLKPIDIDYIRRLSPLTNVLPIIAKADTLTSQQITDLKLSVLNDLRNAGIRAFLFGKSADDVARGLSVCAPFAISTAQAQDETMDASLLMSADYIPPLRSSELGNLVSELFNSENASWLRHASTKKLLAWRSTQRYPAPSTIRTRSQQQQYQAQQQQQQQQSNLRRVHTAGSGSTFSSSSQTMLNNVANGHSSSMIHFQVDPAISLSNGFALARVTDHTQREERLAHIRLARWAYDLQRSLQAERERYQRLARGERAIWLTERLGECVIDGSIIPTTTGTQINNNSNSNNNSRDSSTSTDRSVSLHRPGQQPRQRQRGGVGGGGRATGVGKQQALLLQKQGRVTETEYEYSRRDPLGILRLSDGVKRKAYILFQVAGVGGLAGIIGVLLVRFVWN